MADSCSFYLGLLFEVVACQYCKKRDFLYHQIFSKTMQVIEGNSSFSPRFGILAIFQMNAMEYIIHYKSWYIQYQVNSIRELTPP